MRVEKCNCCDGYGKIKIVDNHKDYTTEICKACNGTGRILTRVYSYEVPFDFDKDKLYKIDSQIIDLLKSLK